MKYRWSSRKPSRKQHICHETGETICKAENGVKNPGTLDILSEIPHPTRKLCGICCLLKSREKQPRKVKLRPSKKSTVDFFLRSREWREVRYLVLKNNDGRCEACGRGKQEGAVLCVDHIKPRIKHPELALTISNLQVLCSECNRGKGSWDETDWNRFQDQMAE